MTSTNNYDVHIGLDVDKKSFSFTTYEKEMKKSKKIPSDPEQFYNYIQKNYPGKKILCAYEAGPTGYHLYDFLTAHNCDCLVVSPSAIPKPSTERVKNNRIDSQTIVQYLKSDNLTSIRVPVGPYRQLRHLVNIREHYTVKRKKARQRIKALLLLEYLYPHIKESDTNWSAGYIKELRTLVCNEAVRFKMDMLLEDLDYARMQLLAIHHKIKTFIKKIDTINQNVEYLQSIPGIGFITATAALGVIGDPVHLKNVREIACFVGLTPRERSTGESVNRGRITHMGNKILRRLLIEASWFAIRYDSELNMFYHRIYHRNNLKAASQKAIVAVARKMTQRMYRVLKDQRMYVIH